jgi:CAAX prenyl protease-like protein
LNVVTLALLVALERVPWFRKMAPAGVEPQTLVAGSEVPRSATRNVPAIYLLPFLAITAASVVSHAVSGDFERFYPLRFLAPLAVMWWYRAEYRRMDLRFGAVGVLVGLAVAGLWIGLHRLEHANGQALAGSLAAMSVWHRTVWIAVRVLAAVVTVPLAEELAFRGFLARRIVSAEVEAVPYARLTVMAVLLSAVCFGLMHGSMWGPGIVSGIVFGLLAKYRDRLGEAVAAHAIANLGIAVWILARGDFSLW